MRDLDARFSELVKSREIPPPGVLRHYTRWEGFEGIVQSSHIWAFDYRTMKDDKDELTWIDRSVVEVGEAILPTLSGEAERALRRVLAIYEKQRLSQKQRIYLACFSEAEDDPIQWRKFSDNGRGVCLSLKVLRGESGEPVPRQSLLPVYYDMAKLRSRLEESFREGLAQEPGDTAADIGTFLLRVAGFEALQFKDKEHETEREWRIVTFLHEEDIGRVPLYMHGEREFVKLRLRAAPRRLVFDEIRLGPNQDDPANCVSRANKVLLDGGYPAAELPPVTISSVAL